MLEAIHWLGHDTVRIDEPLTIYFDPYELSGEHPPADVIFITHEHYDHCSPEDVSKVQKDDTTIVTIAAAAEKLEGDVRIVGPGDKITVKKIEVEAVPAYNINKFRSPGELFHPKEAGHVGFIITLNGQCIYHAGDTDHIPEMANLQEKAIDIAFLPVSGTYVMNADEAVEAAKEIQPQIAVPMHVGRGIGSLEDAQTLKDNAPMEVVILDME